MNSKYIVLVVALSATLISCGGDTPPEINATNCSGGGMQAALPTFKSEATRQAFIDGCEIITKK
jgi:entry exclusion lipoprotein TrbK